MTDERAGDARAADPDRSPADANPNPDPTRPMTDDTDTADGTTTEPDRTDAERDTDGEASGSRFDRLSPDGLRGLLDRVGLAALSLLAVAAGWGFYSQSGNAIRTWFDPAYQPLALAVFNLAVLLVALAGVTHQLRRIRADESAGSVE